MVLTGDKRLRNEVKSKHIEVHGVLWVFDELLRQEIIDSSQAIFKLEILMKTNLRLPKNECQLRLTKWEK
jgi:hypothetical protein